MMENDLHIICSVLSDKTVSQEVKKKIIKKLNVKKKKEETEWRFTFAKSSCLYVKSRNTCTIIYSNTNKKWWDKKGVKKESGYH